MLCFGVLRELLGDEHHSMTFPAGATVGDLVVEMRSHSEGQVWDRIAVAVNREFAPGTHVLADGDEVALLPPVSGGAR